MGPTMRELCQNGSDNASGDGNWFALSVKHQHEWQTTRALSANGVETFLPQYKLRRRWSDRAVDLDMPLFPGYVFGKFSISEKVRVLRTPGVARIVGFGGLPAAVPEQEMERVRAALASKLPLGPWPYLKAGDRVRIERGPLRGVEGTLLREAGSLRLVLSVDLLQRSLAVEIDPELILPVRN